ncbi:MAG: mannose-1-phosphate guanylyltransferase [candidate division WOR-3 bacterium]
MIYTVIMAGGRGTRFWPVSTEKKPKQFLSIVGDRPLIVHTKERVKSLTPPERIKVITTPELKKQIMECGFEKESIFVEPKGMNTLYAIAYSAAKLLKEDKGALMLVLPSDHWIPDSEKFIDTIKKGIKWADLGYLVTYGIVPTRVETGYGYIEKGQKLESSVMRAERFTEKPKIKTANDYVKSKKFLWNSGIFLWQAKTILEEIKEHRPEISKYIEEIEKNPTQRNIKILYEKGVPISIDYGVLERSKKVVVVESHFGWDDVGSWASLERTQIPDENGNIKKGEVIAINCNDNIFYSEDGIIVAKNLSRMIVVRTKDATLIIPKGEAQELKEIVEELPKNYK